MRGKGYTKTSRKIWLMKYERDTFQIEAAFAKKEKQEFDFENRVVISLLKQNNRLIIPPCCCIKEKKKFSIVNFIIGLIFNFFRMIKSSGFSGWLFSLSIG
ncbi:MAG: hypothetical protein PHV23_02255 [Candidatus Gracilibacteria bacterium]|nr:hypothetical protein [Candidatus Gracilibacteria bacterium]